MNGKSHRLLLAMALWTIAAVFVAPIALAQDPAPAPAADPAGDEAAIAEEEKVVREQSIYIPYEKLRKVFEQEGRGVFLPYEKFRELWQAAQDKTAPPDEQKPPVGALITEVENEATVSKDVVRVKALVKIEVLAEGWNRVPLRLGDAAITKATIDGQPARIVAEGGGHTLLVEKKGKAPKQIELALEYAKVITRQPGQNSVSFQTPQAPVSRWRVRIPEAGVKVNLHPLIAATEVTAEGADPAAPDDAPGPDETVVLAFVGAAPTVRIDWTPKAEGATGLAALASVEAQQRVFVNQGLIRTHTELAYTISRAELGQLKIEVPGDQKVVNVVDANVRQWTFEQIDQRQEITVDLFEPAKETQKVTVELEKFTSKDEEATTLAVPVVKALGVGRQQGSVMVYVDGGLRAEATKLTGLLQTELPPNLPPAPPGGQWVFSYRFPTIPFELELGIEKVKPRILVDSLVEAVLEPEDLTLDVLAIYTIEGAGVFQLEMDVPAGFEVRDVRGRAAAGAAAAHYDTHHLEGPENTRLIVNLSRKAFGRAGLAVELHRDLQEPDLLAPTDQEAQIPLPIPQIAPETVERASGRLIVYAPESLRVNPAETSGLRSISSKEALKDMEPAADREAANLRSVLAFAYTQEPATLELAAERLKPRVTIDQLLVAQIEDRAVKYKATFFYEVLYSGVKSLRIDIPADMVALVHNNTEGMSEKVIDPPPADLAEGYVAWSLTGDDELLGKGRIELVWEETIDKPDGQQTAQVTLPVLKPMEVDRAGGQIVLTKAEGIDVQESGEPEGLRPIDPQHELMPGAEVSDAARAFQFDDQWSLTVTATRYELEEVKHTAIERAVLRMVVTRADKIAVQALYRIRSAQQRLVVEMPEGEFDSEPRINGSPVTLEIGQDRKFFVPLVGQNAEEPFLLELRYTVPGDGSLLTCPEFPAEGTVQPMEPAMQKVYLCVYLPQELALFDKEGPWNQEFHWDMGDGLYLEPVPRPGEGKLLSWVAGSAGQAESFPTDGRLYVFSAISPAPSPAGDLELKTVNEDRLSLVVLALVVLAGLLLLPARAAVRVFVVGVLLIGLVVCAVFAPLLAAQIFNGALLATLFIVLIIWVVWYFVWTRPRRRRSIGQQQPAGAGPPPPSNQAATPFAGPKSAGPSAAPPQPPASPQPRPAPPEPPASPSQGPRAETFDESDEWQWPPVELPMAEAPPLEEPPIDVTPLDESRREPPAAEEPPTDVTALDEPSEEEPPAEPDVLEDPLFTDELDIDLDDDVDDDVDDDLDEGGETHA